MLRDPESLALSSPQRLRGARGTIERPYSALRLRLGLAIGGLVLALGTHTMPALHIILLIGGIGAAIWIVVTKQDCERYVTLARLEILPDIDRAIAEGRYGKPPAY